MSLWCTWVLGISKKERFILGSYADGPATDFSRNIRNKIEETKNNESDIIYSDIFPETKTKYGDSAVKRWALEDEHFNFLAAGIIDGAVTSKGATIHIYDDLIKGIQQALNQEHKQKVWKSYTGTWRSRKDSSVAVAKKVMIATRWAKDDPCGMELKENPEDWFVFKMAAHNEDTDEMLCADFLSYEQYMKDLTLAKNDKIREQVYKANYQQLTIDVEGALYKKFKTYVDLPEGEIKAYCDIADEGNDYLCQIIYLKHGKYKYLLDVYFTQEGVEITAPECAKRIEEYEVGRGDYESNNGGKAFAQNVKRIAEENGWENTNVSWFHQSKNKIARIKTNSSNVQEQILYPEGWQHIWPIYYEHMTEFQAEGKNTFDDAQDATTGVIEKGNRVKQESF